MSNAFDGDWLSNPLLLKVFIAMSEQQQNSKLRWDSQPIFDMGRSEISTYAKKTGQRKSKDGSL